MELEIVNINHICRTCKGISPQMRSLFEVYENPHDSPRIDEMLMACASVQVTCGDELPPQICQACLEQLKTAYTFKRQCEKTDVSLREYARNVKVTEIKQEQQNSDFMESLNTLSNLLNEQSTTKGVNEDGSVPPPKIEPDYIRLLEHDQLLLTCRECSEIFSTVQGLRCHKRVHTGNLYKCSKCDKHYARLNLLQRHEETHNRKKVHVCKICNKTLVRVEQLKRHLTTHLREKPFSCTTCNRMFSRVEHLHHHTPRCKGDTVYPCDICSKAYSREDSLQVHKSTHEGTPKPVENLDNVEEHFFQIFQDEGAASLDHSDVDDCFEPEVEVTENFDEDKIKEVAEMGLKEEDGNVSDRSVGGSGGGGGTGGADDDVVGGADDDDDNNDIDHDISADRVTEVVESEEDLVEVKVEEQLNDLEEGDNIADAGNCIGEDDCASNDSEYLPKKSLSPKLKRGRARPRKNPDATRKRKVSGRGTGRPPTRIKKEKREECGEFPCMACNQMFHEMSALDKHVRIKHEGLKMYKCNVCPKDFSRANNLKRHMSSHSKEKPFTCKVCTKSFTRRDHLLQHQKLHGNDFECDICQKPFSRGDHLAKHKAAKHADGEIMHENKYQCPLCPKSFTIKKYRDAHVNGHNGRKEYMCQVCEKTFLTKPLLTQHMKFHDEHAKKFLCSECGQRFIRKDYLVIHMRRHTGEKPFKCKYCGKGFPRTTDLTVHERYHTGEKTHLCTICGRGFGRAFNLTVHMRTHTGEKPYRCTYCTAGFAQGSDLTAHVRRHTGERFHCDLCSDSFLMGYLLTQHKRTVHGLNVVSNVRRIQPAHKEENPDEPPPITIPLPKPVNPMYVNPEDPNSLHAQLAEAQLHLAREEISD